MHYQLPNTAASSIGSATKSQKPHYVIIVLTMAVMALEISSSRVHTGAWEVLLLLLATVGSISGLAVQLPLQSVLFAALLTASMGCAAHALSVLTGIPFGPIAFGQTIGLKLFKTVPLAMGAVWIVFTFSSRGVARLILRPWRQVPNYGFWLMGLTAVFTSALFAALEPFGKLRHFWLWQHTKMRFTWFDAPVLYYFVLSFMALIILGMISPFFIRKQPGESDRSDITPLLVWLGGLAMFLTASIRAGQWNAVIFDAALMASVTLPSLRGVFWKTEKTESESAERTA